MNKASNDDLVKYRLSKYRELLGEIEIHIEHELWHTAINRLYYACYYAVSALLLSKNIKPHTHGGVRQMLGLHFIKQGIIREGLGKFYSDLFDKRQTSDYDDFVQITKEDVYDMYPNAKELITQIDKLLND